MFQNNSHLLDFSRRRPEEFDIPRSDDVAVFGQTFGAFFFRGEHDESVASGSAIVFLDEQDADLAVHHRTSHTLAAGFKKLDLAATTMSLDSPLKCKRKLQNADVPLVSACSRKVIRACGQ